jgi:4-amino-4-deoxy-L-arabinose transferase-like glycosyltransferase
MVSMDSARIIPLANLGKGMVSLARQPVFWMALAYFVLLSLNLGRPALNDGEAMYAEIPREMRVSGDWISPRLNGTREFEKPPLIYWVIGISQEILGEKEGAARIWSVLATAATVLLVSAIGGNLYGHRAGRFAGLVFATCLGPFIFGGQVMIEPMLIFWISLAILSYLRGYVCPGKAAGFWSWLMFASIGLATLSKGLLGLGLASAIIGSHVLLSGRLRLFMNWRSLGGLGVVTVIVVPWHLAVGLANPDFFGYFLIHEHWQRFTGTRFPRHEFLSLPVFLILTFLWTFPWIAIVPQALKRAAHRLFHGDWRLSPDLLPCLWMVLVIGLFSAARLRLEYYALPAIPAFALLVGKFWDEMLVTGADRPSMRASVIALSVMSALLVSCALVSYVVLGPGKELVFKAVAELWPLAGWTSGPEQVAALERIRIPSLAAMVLAAVFTIAAAWALVRSRSVVACGFMAAMMVPLFLFVHHGFLVMEPFMSTRPIAEMVNRSAGPADVVVVQDPAEYMWIGGITYYTKRMVHVLKRPDYDRVPAHRREPADRFLDLQGLAALWKSGKRVLLVANEDLAAQLRFQLLAGGPVGVIGRCAGVMVLSNSRGATAAQEEPDSKQRLATVPNPVFAPTPVDM